MDEIEGTPEFHNCGNQELEAVFSEKGQYKGSWCQHCGSMNVAGTARKPESLKE